MKYIKTYYLKVFISIFFVSSIISIFGQSENVNKKENLTQGIIRQNNKWQISVIQPTMYSLNLQYNLSSKFSIGTALFYKDEYVTKNTIGIVGRNTLGFISQELDTKRMIAKFDLKYFPFEKFPIYATIGLGRDFIGKSYTNEYWGAWIVDTSRFSPYPQTYTIDYEPEYLYSYGIGFQWIFKNNFFVAIEVNKILPLDRKKNSHLYTHVRGIPNTSLIPIQSYIISALTIPNVDIDGERLPKGMLWFGYSFKL